MKTLIIATLLTLITFNVQANSARDIWLNDNCLPLIVQDVDLDVELTSYKLLEVIEYKGWFMRYTVKGNKTRPWGEKSEFSANYTCGIDDEYDILGVVKASIDVDLDIAILLSNKD